MQSADPCEPETGVDVAATTSSTLTLQLPLELSVVPQGETEDSSSGVPGLATSVGVALEWPDELPHQG